LSGAPGGASRFIKPVVPKLNIEHQGIAGDVMGVAPKPASGTYSAHLRERISRGMSVMTPLHEQTHVVAEIVSMAAGKQTLLCNRGRFPDTRPWTVTLPRFMRLSRGDSILKNAADHPAATNVSRAHPSGRASPERRPITTMTPNGGLATPRTAPALLPFEKSLAERFVSRRRAATSCMGCRRCRR